MLTALTTATAAASPPTPMGPQADRQTLAALTPGFLLDQGRYTTLEVPGATVETAPGAINNRGQIVGGARGGGFPTAASCGTRAADTPPFRFPGARSTLAQKINDRGQITGLYSTTTDDPRDGADPAGFLLRPRAATPASRSPARAPPPRSGSTTAARWSASTRTPTAAIHGYVWERGRFTTIDAPGAAGTSLTDINDRGQIVGVRLEADGTFRGFMLERGRFTTFAAPGAVITIPGDINNRGQIVGSTATDRPTETALGFLLAKGVKGPAHPDQLPRCAQHLGVRPQRRGQITGTYNNPNAAPSPPPATAPPMGWMG